MSQFLNYITKKTNGGDINSLPGVLSLSAIQKKIELDKQKKVRKDPELRQYTPKPGDIQRQAQYRKEYLDEQNSLYNRVANNPTVNKFMDNIASPMMTMADIYGVTSLLRTGVKQAAKAAKNIYSEPEITRGFIDWGKNVNYADNPGFDPRRYENAVKNAYTPPTTDPALAPYLTYKDFREGGEMIRRADGSYSRRGLWDNIRANKGSGKKPTKEMLKQERKIRAEEAAYGMEIPFDYAAAMAAAYGELPEMKNGGIPERYKNMGFSRVGQKKESSRPGKKWMVLAKKGDQYKVVHGGYDGMKDYTQHGSEKRRERFWDRMGGKNSAKAKDPFSPLYWHKRLGTWKDGGTFSGNLFYQQGGPVEGDEMEVTPEQMEQLRKLGYQFETI